jgi:hypothetical protein
MSDLPQFLLDMLAAPPRAGDGVHPWMFRVARQLHAHRSEEEICSLLKAELADCGRIVTDTEILEAVQNSKASAWYPRGSRAPIFIPKPRWPERDLNKIDSIVRSGPGLADIMDLSPVRFDGQESHAEEIIDVVFPGDPLLCCGKCSEVFATRRRQTWRGKLSALPLIVPNPMISVYGTTQSGKRSQHTKENTGAKIYQPIEFDFSEKCRNGIDDSVFAPLVRGWNADGITVTDAGCALLLHLVTLQPTLAVVCHSGGKSVHGWFRVAELDESKQREFMELAVSLGADHATWLRSQFVRIPDGLRDTGVRQAAFYLNPQEAIRA